METYNTFTPYVYTGNTLPSERFNDDYKYFICCCSHYKISRYSRAAHIRCRKHIDYMNKNPDIQAKQTEDDAFFAIMLTDGNQDI